MMSNLNLKLEEPNRSKVESEMFKRVYHKTNESNQMIRSSYLCDFQMSQDLSELVAREHSELIWKVLLEMRQMAEFYPGFPDRSGLIRTVPDEFASDYFKKYLVEQIRFAYRSAKLAGTIIGERYMPSNIGFTIEPVICWFGIVRFNFIEVLEVTRSTKLGKPVRSRKLISKTDWFTF